MIIIMLLCSCSKTFSGYQLVHKSKPEFFTEFSRTSIILRDSSILISCSDISDTHSRLLWNLLSLYTAFSAEAFVPAPPLVCEMNAISPPMHILSPAT